MVELYLTYKVSNVIFYLKNFLIFLHRYDASCDHLLITIGAYLTQSGSPRSLCFANFLN